MKIINTKFKGLKIIQQKSFKDKRGFLRVTHNQKLVNKKNHYFSRIHIEDIGIYYLSL